MLLLLDNYDSFTYNLYQYLAEMGQETVVARNDKIDLQGIAAMAPAAIIISPGPSTPLQAGISNEVIRRFAPTVPILGVCLGHQCIGHVFGGVVSRAPVIMHGKSSLIHHKQQGVFRRLPTPFRAIRYHSLAVERPSLPDCLEVTAWTEDGLIMGLRHREFRVQGIQFHPESFMTEYGKEILRNFLESEVDK